MSHKVNADKHRTASRPKRQMSDLQDCDQPLRQRGSLTVWFTDEAIADWRAEPRTTPGGQPHYSVMAITTALTLRMHFHMALRQTEDLIGSILSLLGVDLPVPDHTTLSRRAKTLPLPTKSCSSAEAAHLLVDSTGLKLYDPDEWLVEKHGSSRQSSWRKIHIGMDAVSGRIGAAILTDHSINDAPQVGPLLD